MFWRKSYTPSQNIEALLNKENVTVEEFLEEDDILQECKTLENNISNYFTRPDVIKRLVELIITEPSEDLPLAQRFRHANMACEVLTLGLPSINGKIVSDDDILRILYSFLENKPPLNPLLSSFFSKTFGMLFKKSFDQDWFLYQKMCLQLIEYIKSQGNFLELIFNHFSTPVIPDLLMQMMIDVQGGALKKNLYEWLTEERLVERLIAILGDAKESEKHANVSEFLCELITQGRSMRQTEQENDSFEPAFVGSNPLLQVIESEATINSLLNIILEPSSDEGAIISGILVVLTLVKPVVFTDAAATDRTKVMQEKEKENHDNIISTVIRVVQPRLKEFVAILQNPPVKPNMLINGAKLLPPFGSMRLEICRLFTVLLQTGNEDIANAICETDYFNIILALFMDYSWNNFLHSEVEKCLQIVFSPNKSNTNNSINNNNNISTQTTKDGSFQNEDDQIMDETVYRSNVEAEKNDSNTMENKSPSALQTFVIFNSKIVSKLIDCWMHNNEVQKGKYGRRLGYMGHLMKIFKHITECISESEHIGALIESSLSETELEQWQSLIKPQDGEFTMALAEQSRLLANCNAQESVDYTLSIPLGKEFILNSDFSTFGEEELKELTAAISSAIGTMDESLSDNIWNDGDILSPIRGEGDVAADPFNDLSQIGQDDNNDSNPTPIVGWADFSADNFADFDAHFSTFSNDLGESMSATNEKAALTLPNEDPLAVNLLFSPSSPALKTEFDNNANVEKTSSIDPFEDDSEDAFFSIKTGEQGNSDDGTWTTSKNTNATVISNGPTAIHDTKDIEELSNQLKSTSITENNLVSSSTTTTTKPPLVSTFNEDKNDEQFSAQSENNITQDNNPPPSTNESLCQKQESSNAIIINQDIKTNSSPASTAAEEITPAL